MMSLRPSVSRIVLRNVGAWLIVFLLMQIHQLMNHHRFITKTAARNTNFFIKFPSSATTVKHTKQSPSPADTDTRRPARFLMGIFSVAGDVKRRDILRRGLQVYNMSRVCPFGSSHHMMPSSSSSAISLFDDCELMYTFVIGANLNGSKQIVKNELPNLDDTTKEIASLITQPPSEWNYLTSEPDDITFLNIQENMNEGKSPTWFYYASQVLKLYDWDYAIKCDSDTGVRIDMFLEFAHDNLPRGATSVYAGKMAPSRNQRDQFYLQGQFYVLSRDVAERVSHESIAKHLLLPAPTATTTKPQRGRIAPPTVYVDEDSVIGKAIMKGIPNVHLIVTSSKRTWEGRRMMPWKHNLKNETRLERFIRGESLRVHQGVVVGGIEVD